MLRDALSPSERSLRSQRFGCRLRHTKRRRDFLAAEPSRRHALHGDTLSCVSHHVVVKRLENTWDLVGNVACGEWICRRVGHVRRRAMWENLLFYAIFYTRGHFLPKRDRNLMFFTLISGSPFHAGILRKMEYGCLEYSEKDVRHLGCPMLAAHPVI